jgi:hypothetical protein
MVLFLCSFYNGVWVYIDEGTINLLKTKQKQFSKMLLIKLHKLQFFDYKINLKTFNFF